MQQLSSLWLIQLCFVEVVRFKFANIEMALIADARLTPQITAEIQGYINSQAGSLTRWNKVVECLTKHRIAFKRTLLAEEIMTHPKNRAGMGLNAPFIISTGGAFLGLLFSLAFMKDVHEIKDQSQEIQIFTRCIAIHYHDPIPEYQRFKTSSPCYPSSSSPRKDERP